jgi:hypothetical protein
VEDARHLQIPEGALREAGEIVLADDTTVPYLESAVPIRAQVLLRASPTVSARPWGPIFELRPAFVPEGSRLFGQRDFFSRFEITFRRHVNPASFTLRY